MSRRIERAVAGDPFDKNTEIGPLIDAKAVQRVKELIESAKKSGAKLIAGATGSNLEHSKWSRGFYVKPLSKGARACDLDGCLYFVLFANLIFL